ncbi:MAG: pantoate--beta-alanine ligase [Gammaproteobacteria bacterium]|nr:MAG: pantoate--beta-alanine ligase [Gammaproteobacteria bacterium]
METVAGIEALRGRVAAWRAGGERIGFVPTMGNLHAGHLSLVDRARARADRVVVSVFVNPLQFGPGEDYETYPRTLEQDRAVLAEHRVDLLFAPPVEAMFPRGREETTFVEVPGLGAQLCGAFRPGFFRGVATVVARLFNLVQPDLAVFGEKDYQQLVLVRRMVQDLAFPVEILGAPTVREPDGLAMSSRNAYLTPEERRQAPLLYRTLCDLARELETGRSDYASLERAAMSRLEAGGFRPEYVAIRRAEDLAAPGPETGSLRVLAAAWLGRARLIDNLPVER